MCFNFSAFRLFFVFFLLTGCATQKNFPCKPVLFPYPEYRYRAESQLLLEAYPLPPGQEIITFCGLKIPIPKGWHYERIFHGKTVKIFKEKERFFFVSMTRLTQYTSYFPYFPYVDSLDCDWAGAQSNAIRKTQKDYYTDLYFFTDTQLSDAPDAWPWQYSILSSKAVYFHDAMRLVHYKGMNLEAFQKNHDPYIKPDRDVQTTIEIFPKKIKSVYFEMGSDFQDDLFFVNFINMVNMLNP